jgi:drug/metabolite transporter (DMT)-like permease
MSTITKTPDTTVCLQETSATMPNQKVVMMLAFAGVYVLWGSTYLAIRILMKTVPLFLMSSMRMLLAGLVMCAWAWLAKHSFPTRSQLIKSCSLGFLLLIVGNGAVLLSNKFIASSGVIAIVVSITPLWVVLLQWWTGKTTAPTLSVWLGIALGIIGMGVLIGPQSIGHLGENATLGVVILVLSSLSWAMGTIYSAKGNLPESPIMNSAVQMLFASVGLGILGLLQGEWVQVDLGSYGTRELYSFLFLVFGGSVVGFTSFTYIARHASPSSASTYAYVNPVIALFLGWWLGNEIIGGQTILASVLLVAAVAMIVIKPKWKRVPIIWITRE